MSETETLDPRQTTILENVDQNGWAVMHVPAERDDAPSFTFSVGFEHSLGQPEVLIYGLERNLAISMINALFQRCRDEGIELEDGLAIGELIEGYDCIARPIEDPRARAMHFGYAAWFRRYRDGEELRRAMQIVWPDPENRAFPWEEGCSSVVRGAQVQLYPSGGPR